MPAAEPLDNVVWHALTGPHERFAQGGPEALRFQPDVAPFAALPDEPRREAWEALREIVGAGEVTALFRHLDDVPSGWEVVTRMPCRQMLCRGELRPPARPAARDAGARDLADRDAGARASAADDSAARAERAPLGDSERLGANDVPAMLDLVARTRPGPFSRRTHELGRYVGVRAGGALVAMAGERIRIAGATEISAVCTSAEYRRRGLGAALVAELAASIRARGELPFLHVLVDNLAAIRVYEALGFETRAEIPVHILRAPR